MWKLRVIAVFSTAFAICQALFPHPCDCTIYPFKPASCFKECTARIIAAATPEQLQKFLGLDETLAKAVAEKGKGGKGTALEKLKKNLRPDQFQRLDRALDAQTQDSVKKMCEELGSTTPSEPKAIDEANPLEDQPKSQTVMKENQYPNYQRQAPKPSFPAD